MDYILALKGNQGSLQEDAQRTVRFTKSTGREEKETRLYITSSKADAKTI
ncbi:MAG: hypothetical protein QM751_04115 [Paludibacteraceae bacterium]